MMDSLLTPVPITVPERNYARALSQGFSRSRTI